MGLPLPLFAWLLWLSRGEGDVPLGGADLLRILQLGMFGYKPSRPAAAKAAG